MEKTTQKKPKKGVPIAITEDTTSPQKNEVLSTIPITQTHQKKSITLTGLKTATTKIKISDNTQKNVKKSKTITKVEKKVIALPPERHLSLLSPFRFPLPDELRVSTIARFAGVAFVIVGGFFSLLNLPYMSGTAPQMSVGEHNVASINTANEMKNVATNAETKPNPTIMMDMVLPLKEIVPINITVPYAQHIQVTASNESNTTRLLGSAEQIDATTWKFNWDTNQYPDGEYTFRFSVTNEFGTYQYTDSKKYGVENSEDLQDEEILDEAIDTTDAEEEDVNTEAGTTTDEVTTDDVVVPGADTEITLSFSSDSNFSESITIDVVAPNATDVRVFAKNEDADTVYFIGYGTLVHDGLWNATWDTTRVPNGTYSIHAKAVVSGTPQNSKNYSVSVENENAYESVTEVESLSEPETPEVVMSISTEVPLTGFVDISFESSPVNAIEVFALPKYSNTPLFLGNALRISETEWKFIWETNQIPNGEYYVYPHVAGSYGEMHGNNEEVQVQNAALATLSESEQGVIDVHQQAHSALSKTTDTPEAVVAYAKNPLVYIEPVTAFMETIDADPTIKDEITATLNDFIVRLETLLKNLVQATRANDEENVKNTTDEIDRLPGEIAFSLPETIAGTDAADKINAYLARISSEQLSLTTKNETLLKERLGDAILRDSDEDSIPDYDELTVHHTSPFAADTDGDGYPDAVEIEGGYDPLSAKSEVLPTLSSPKEDGTTRSDILSVDVVATFVDEGATKPKAIISGTGLPNSFVKLFVFSTPVEIFVKTDSTGKWSYIFDKQIENGLHEVYVGITNNEGTVVAKSNPFTFIKTADAYTEYTDEVAVTNIGPADSEPVQSQLLLLVASIAVTALGLVLMLFGLHLHPKKKEDGPILAS